MNYTTAKLEALKTDDLDEHEVLALVKRLSIQTGTVYYPIAELEDTVGEMALERDLELTQEELLDAVWYIMEYHHKIPVTNFQGVFDHWLETEYVRSKKVEKVVDNA